jgi:serine/threonine protein phosphatase PrpC
VAGQCPACATGVGDADRFCEACGYDLVTGTPAAPVPEPVRPVSGASRWISADAPAQCPGCAGTSIGAEGYCDTCGQRQPTIRAHSELDLGSIAAVSDKGHRHHRNEDAVGLAVRPGLAIAVVCDGVSSSTRPDTASHAAVDQAIPALLAALSADPDPERALLAATQAAQTAAAAAAGAQPGPNPPSSTLVAAVVTGTSITVGWVGDSRAYWLPVEPGEPVCLTTDDSLAEQLAAAGAGGSAPPRVGAGTALVRWLGADAPDTAPHLVTIRPELAGRVLVCSDGLFRYRPEPAALAAATPAGTPLSAARDLVQLALDAGGQDNVTVAVLPYPAAD